MNTKANFSHELRYKNPQQKISKLNPVMKKNYTLKLSRVYSRYGRLVQYSKIHQYNVPRQQNKDEKSHDHIN